MLSDCCLYHCITLLYSTVLYSTVLSDCCLYRCINYPKAIPAARSSGGGECLHPRHSHLASSALPQSSHKHNLAKLCHDCLLQNQILHFAVCLAMHSSFLGVGVIGMQCRRSLGIINLDFPLLQNTEKK